MNESETSERMNCAEPIYWALQNINNCENLEQPTFNIKTSKSNITTLAVTWTRTTNCGLFNTSRPHYRFYGSISKNLIASLQYLEIRTILEIIAYNYSSIIYHYLYCIPLYPVAALIVYLSFPDYLP